MTVTWPWRLVTASTRTTWLPTSWPRCARSAGVSQRQAAKSLNAICSKILHALQTLQLPELTAEEGAFAARLKASIAARAERLRKFAQDLPKIEL
jgi:hypothetical protein